MPPVDIDLVNLPPWSLEDHPVGVLFLATYLARHGFNRLIFEVHHADQASYTQKGDKEVQPR
jgi:hypothetical protein